MMKAGCYEIRVEGHLGPHWSEWFGGFALSQGQDGSTTLTGAVVDGAALFGLLDRVRDAGLTLVSVNRMENEMGGAK
jgi:hypothetical protein